MKPLLTNSKPALTETMPNCCFPLTSLLTTNDQIGIVSLTYYSKLKLKRLIIVSSEL
jgi:hypothetical protein